MCLRVGKRGDGADMLRKAGPLSNTGWGGDEWVIDKDIEGGLHLCAIQGTGCTPCGWGGKGKAQENVV